MIETREQATTRTKGKSALRLPNSTSTSFPCR
jgi:hypothetical protein